MLLYLLERVSQWMTAALARRCAYDKNWINLNICWASDAKGIPSLTVSGDNKPLFKFVGKAGRLWVQATIRTIEVIDEEYDDDLVPQASVNFLLGGVIATYNQVAKRGAISVLNQEDRNYLVYCAPLPLLAVLHKSLFAKFLYNIRVESTIDFDESLNDLLTEAAYELANLQEFDLGEEESDFGNDSV